MSIITLFTRHAPTIAGLEFDAVLEDTFELEITTTGYPIESGARAADHRIIQPYRWSLIGGVSNNPIKPVVTDFTGLLSGGSQIGAQLSGLAAGFLSGSNETRSADALTFLVDLATQSEPFDIDAGDIQLSNMVIASIRRVKDPVNEGGLIFEASLQEYPTLETLLSRGSTKQFQLRDGDQAKSQIAEVINRGEQAIRDTGASIRSAVSSFFGG